MLSRVTTSCVPPRSAAPTKVRPAGSDVGDQRRVATPREAIARGADLLVIGRPITGAPDVAAAAAAIAEDLGHG
jgi:orotidine-5'-phosphate decarboxylase